MTLKVVFFEDDSYSQFYPLTYLRPVYNLRAGITPLVERVRRYFGDVEIALTAREQVAPLVTEASSDYPVNILKKPDGAVLFLNGRVRDYGDLPDLVKGARVSTIFRNGDETVAVYLDRVLLEKAPSVGTQVEYQDVFNQQTHLLASAETRATLYNYCWEIMADIEKEIEADFEYLKPEVMSAASQSVPAGVNVVCPERIHVGQATLLRPGAILDASEGPIFIGNSCRIDAQAAIYGPCYIGDYSVVVAGKIVGSSIGSTCRVGGEIEESIFHSYVNKYHAGFIGHSYVGPWVNFGAMTTNSDLKNNYSPIRAQLNGKEIDTGSIKVGSFIGDHSKFGIGTLLNTGINIGLCCNIFGGTLVTDKEVPSFRWGSSGGWAEYQIEKAIKTARLAMERRQQPLSDRQETVLREVAQGNLSSDGILNFEPTNEDKPDDAVAVESSEEG
jgi:UDP-N-acetylglucosamine diphosphorylase/glucosamine-1-phosphate N-acetyltransferase